MFMAGLAGGCCRVHSRFAAVHGREGGSTVCDTGAFFKDRQSAAEESLDVLRNFLTRT